MVVSRRGISHRMIGRGDVLAELRQLFDGVSGAGCPAVAMITGEAGIGKTRLLRELIAAADPDLPMVVGQAREGDIHRSFALVRDVLEGHLDPAGTLPETLARWHHPLGHLLEPLVAMSNHPADGHEHAQEELARAGVAMLRHLADPGPAVVAFEDLHWADAESLEVFARLARSDARMLLVGTLRPEDFDRRHPLGGLLSELERQGSVSHVAVEGLTRAQLAEFLEEVCGEPADAAAIERLHRRTRGNPFFLEELLTATETLAAGRTVPFDAAMLAEASLPWSTNEAALRRLERFDEETRTLLQTAAVLGDRFEVLVLAGVLEQDAEQLLPQLTQLVRDGVLVEHGATTFAFRHALTCEAAAGEVLASERRVIHAGALDVLLADGKAASATLAEHALAAGRMREAASHARDAARKAAHGGAPREVLRLALIALEDDPGQLEMHELASQVALQLGSFEEATRHAERWRAFASDAADLEGEAMAGCHLAWALWWVGEAQASWEALRAALAVAEDLQDSRVRAEVLTMQARWLAVSNQFVEAVASAGEAVAAAERVGDARLLAKAWLYEGFAMLDSPEHQGEEDLRRAAMLLDRAREAAARLVDVDTLAAALLYRLVPDQPDDVPLERSWELLDEAFEFADRYGIERLANKLKVIEAQLAITDGDQEHAERALVTARRAALAPLDATWRASIDAFLGLERGDVERAEAASQTQRDLLDKPQQAEIAMDRLRVEAALAAQCRDAARAEAVLRRAGPAVGTVGISMAAMWWEVALSALDAGVAPAVVRQLMDSEGPTAVPRRAGLIQHTHGVLLAAEGKRDEAVDALRLALGHERRGRPTTLLADAHHRLAELLGARGERDAAREHAAAAITLLDRWPGPRRSRAEALQRRLGDARASSHELFTARELDVVKLVARGYTNSDIAEQLFITRKTASTHVSNILSKTGFERRTQVAIWAMEEGIAHRVE